MSSILLIVFSLGMSSAPRNAPVVSLNEQIRKQVGQTIEGLKSSYDSENLPDFMKLLDKDFENRLSFQSLLENYFISHKNPQLTFIIDAVLMNKDKLSVRLHWFKKNFDNFGVFSKSQGSAQFAFKQYPEGLKLIYIRQDNPFF